MATSFSFFRRLDKAGRVVIPRDLRRILRLRPGDGLAMRLCEEGILLYPADKAE